MHLLCGACFFSGCGFPSFDFRASSTDAAPSCTADAGSVDLCASLPAFVGAQVVDGVGDEFCDVPAHVFDKSSAALTFPATPPADVTEVVTVRAAASADALHLHVHVRDPNVLVVEAGSGALHLGDSLEVYAFAGAPTHGNYGASGDVGAHHIILAPPADGIAARAFVFESDCTLLPAPIDPSFYAGRIVADGWELELRIPWSFLGPTSAPPPKSGAPIGFDLALNAKDDPNAKQREMQAFIGFRAVSPASSDCTATCTTADAEPFCDDRTWCAPTLQ